MCRQFEKDEYDTIPECLYELKYTEPYVNLLDFIDVFRTDQKVPRFYDWKAFVNYTLKGRALKQKYAHKSEFLEPLLQNLRRGPPCKPRTGMLPPSRTDSYHPAPRSDDRSVSKRPCVPAFSLRRPDPKSSEPIKAEPPSAPIMSKAMPPPSRREPHPNVLLSIQERNGRYLDRDVPDNEDQAVALPHDDYGPGKTPHIQQRHAPPTRPDVELSEAIKAEPLSALTRPQTPTPREYDPSSSRYELPPMSPESEGSASPSPSLRSRSASPIAHRSTPASSSPDIAASSPRINVQVASSPVPARYIQSARSDDEFEDDDVEEFILTQQPETSVESSSEPVPSSSLQPEKTKSEEERIQEALRDEKMMMQLTQDFQDDDPDEVFDYAALGKRKCEVEDVAEHSRITQSPEKMKSEEEKMQEEKVQEEKIQDELLRDDHLLTQLTQDVQDDDPNEVLAYTALGKRKRADESNEESGEMTI